MQFLEPTYGTVFSLVTYRNTQASQGLCNFAILEKRERSTARCLTKAPVALYQRRSHSNPRLLYVVIHKPLERHPHP